MAHLGAKGYRTPTGLPRPYGDGQHSRLIAVRSSSNAPRERSPVGRRVTNLRAVAGNWTVLKSVTAIGVLGALATGIFPSHASGPATQATEASTISPAQSLNWSGYEGLRSSLSQTTFSSVGAAFVVPSLSCPRGGTLAVSIWAGFGGVATNDPLYQDGIVGNCKNGNVSYDAWHEVVLGPYQDPHAISYGVPVHAGDHILAEAFYFGSTLALDLWDLQDSNGINGGDLGGPAYSNVPQALTAECIVERPSYFLNGPYYRLANFGSETFAPFSGLGFGCGAADQTNHEYQLNSPVAPWNDYPVNMGVGHHLLSTAAISGSATVTFHASS